MPSASITCPNNKELFEVSCTIADGFDVRINDLCRKSYYPFIDFTNSFVWGDPTKIQMEIPTGSSGADVDKVGLISVDLQLRLIYS